MDQKYFQDWEETKAWSYDPPIRRRKKPSAFRALAKTLVFLLFFLGFLAIGCYLAGWGQEGEENGSHLSPVADASQKVLPVLLLGVDQRVPGEPARADTIIIAFLDKEDKKARLLSIPRDTYTWVPGYGYKSKINAANALKGPEGSLEAVNDLCDLNIKYYVETNFEGFQTIVDTLGGVEIDVDRRMYRPSENIDLYPGPQHLNGYEALAYVRFRDYPLADIERIEHQQRFFQALAEEARDWRNLWKLPELVKSVNEAMETNLGTTDMLSLAKTFRSIDSAHLETYKLPGDPQTVDGLDCWAPREEEIAPLIEALMAGETYEPVSDNAVPVTDE